MLAAAFSGTDLAAVAVIVVLLALAAVLVAAEEAISRTSPVRIESLEGVNPRKAARLVHLLAEPQAVVNPLRLLVLILQLVETTLVALVAARFLSWPLVALVVALNACLVFVVAETVPRTLGILRADRLALALVRPIELVAELLPVRLLAGALIAITNWVV
ncbi:MAG: DUF21 domain-containing protein, partial [Acidimicrobiia bacterium]|nr:DUF21 domain-containing protein [Acidimicrobiia bacterium]